MPIVALPNSPTFADRFRRLRGVLIGIGPTGAESSGQPLGVPHSGWEGLTGELATQLGDIEGRRGRRYDQVAETPALQYIGGRDQYDMPEHLTQAGDDPTQIGQAWLVHQIAQQQATGFEHPRRLDEELESREFRGHPSVGVRVEHDQVRTRVCELGYTASSVDWSDPDPVVT